MKTYIFKALFILSYLVCPAITWAEFRIATVDLNRVLNEFSEAKEKRKTLDDMSLQAKKKVDEKGRVLKETEKKIQEGKVAQDSKEAEAFRAEAKNFSRYVKDTEEDLRKEFLKVNRTLTQKVFKAVDDYAKKNGIQMVLDKSEAGRGPVLFGAPESDITEEIIKVMNS